MHVQQTSNPIFTRRQSPVRLCRLTVVPGLQNKQLTVDPCLVNCVPFAFTSKFNRVVKQWFSTTKKIKKGNNGDERVAAMASATSLSPGVTPGGGRLQRATIRSTRHTFTHTPL
ncbi:unnamed protein product [Leptidea sinapis]|uniref:Uncharacterized protein n=1 Tax=Leptidea sinapis TaxID=189913 RepID=A0A5E4QZH4_9NEOP|nr:unnamed protein product [Leptidea sinapis]